LLGWALALGFIVCTSVTASACSWDGCGDDYDYYSYYPPRPAYNYYVIVPNGYGGYRLVRTLRPYQGGLFPPRIIYGPPTYRHRYHHRRHYHDYDYE
jgi:hypothetical protein